MPRLALAPALFREVIRKIGRAPARFGVLQRDRSDFENRPDTAAIGQVSESFVDFRQRSA